MTCGAARPSPARGEGGADEQLGPDTPEYWRARLAEVDELIAGVEEQLERLPEYRRSETVLPDGRILWVLEERARLTERLDLLRGLRRGIEAEARRAGIPPGWLRYR